MSAPLQHPLCHSMSCDIMWHMQWCERWRQRRVFGVSELDLLCRVKMRTFIEIKLVSCETQKHKETRLKCGPVAWCGTMMLCMAYVTKWGEARRYSCGTVTWHEAKNVAQAQLQNTVYIFIRPSTPCASSIHVSQICCCVGFTAPPPPLPRGCGWVVSLQFCLTG